MLDSSSFLISRGKSPRSTGGFSNNRLRLTRILFVRRSSVSKNEPPGGAFSRARAVEKVEVPREFTKGGLVKGGLAIRLSFDLRIESGT